MISYQPSLRDLLQVPDTYQPIDYQIQPVEQWGKGAQIRAFLTPAQWSVWERVLPLQDKRDDPGQGEIVTYFAALLSAQAGLSPQDRDVPILAAIFHDTGYARIPNIDALFRRLGYGITQLDDPELRASARKELLEIRYLHQKHSVDIAKETIPHHPRLDLICDIIGDHDTRERAPHPLGRFMWDGDVHWRFTLPGIRAGMIQCCPNREITPGYNHTLLSQLMPRSYSFLLPESLPIAQFEFLRTMQLLLEDSSPHWSEISKYFPIRKSSGGVPN